MQVVTLGLIVGIGLQYAQAWQGPTQAPPNGNVAGPLTTSNISQTKTGPLILGGLAVTGAVAFTGIGGTNCGLETDALGNVTCGVKGGGGGGVTSIIAGSGITISGGTGNVTISTSGGGGSIPSGMIAMFATACSAVPGGWTHYAAMNGRFARGEAAGQPLGTGGTDDAVVVSHTHNVAAIGGLTTASGGSHTHGLPIRSGGAGGSNITPLITSGTASASNLNTTAGGGAHTHDFTVPAHNTASAGVSGTGQNIPRYQEVFFCQKN